MRDLTGERFGKLVVVERAETSRNGHIKWAVVCDCGKSKTVFGTHLKQGNTTSCGCNKRRPRNFAGVGDLPKTYFSSIKRGAEGGKGRSPIPFDLTMEYLWDLFLEQKKTCAYSGLALDFRAKTASLDRIDSSKGYEEGNVQWLHKDVNMMKRHYSEGYFFRLCSMISNHCTGANCEI